MRRILFEQTDFNTLPNPPAGFQYIGFNGLTFSQKDNNGDTTQPSGTTKLVELTYSEAIDLLSGQGVVEGTRYLITGFDVELYGQRIEIQFIEKIRSEKRFDSFEDLKNQIAADLAWARMYLA